MKRARRRHRGLTLLELTLAMIVTGIVAGAILGMMGAVTAGVDARRDSRTNMVTASAATARLSAYIAPARAMLEVQPTRMAVWINDARVGETVHATEIRWFTFDERTGVLAVHFVSFPSDWTQTMQDLEDKEYALGTNWFKVLGDYANNGWITVMPLLERLEAVTIDANAANAIDARHATLSLTFPSVGANPVQTLVPVSIRLHQPPVS
jgi:prepilin-type N-terminal cleavage/methylation domain-containing protein